MRTAKERLLIGIIHLLILTSVAASWSESAAAAGTCDAPGMQWRPIMSTHKAPGYPSLSQMVGEQGTTVLQLILGKDGQVIKAEAVESSGSLRLDQAALDYVKANWRWEPPIKDCQPSEVTTRVSGVWNLLDAPSGPPPGIVEGTPDPTD